MKKFLALLLSTMLIIGIIPTMALAAEPLAAPTELAVNSGQKLYWSAVTGAESYQVLVYDTSDVLVQTIAVNNVHPICMLNDYVHEAGDYKVSVKAVAGGVAGTESSKLAVTLNGYTNLAQASGAKATTYTATEKSTEVTFQQEGLTQTELGTALFDYADFSSGWISSGYDGYYVFELPKKAQISEIVAVISGSNTNIQTFNYGNLKYSVDGVEWTDIKASYDTSTGSINLGGSQYYKTFTLSAPITAKYIVSEKSTYSSYKSVVYAVGFYGTELPDYTKLSELTVSEGTLTPAFDPSVLEYEVEIEDIESIPTVSAFAESDGAEVEITQATAETMKATVKVTFPNAESTVYSVTFKEVSVIPDNATDLSSISLSAGTLSPAFSAGSTIYTVEIAHDSSIPTVSATPAVNGATATVTQATAETMKATVTVTYPGVDASKVYTVNFSRLPAPEVEDVTKLSSLTLSSGTLAPQFSPDVTSYSVEIPNKNSIPTVSAVAEKGEATVTITQATAENLEATVVVSCENQQKTYTVSFIDLSSNLKFTGDVLSWRAVEGATSYTVTVYNADGTVNREVNITATAPALPETQYDFTAKIAPAGTYSFTVTPSNLEGVMGDASEPVSRSFGDYANQALSYNGGKATTYNTTDGNTIDGSVLVSGAYGQGATLADKKMGYYLVELANICEIDKLMIATNQSGASPVLNDLEYSVDGKEWYTLSDLSWSKYQDPKVSTYRNYTAELPSKILARYIKLSKKSYTDKKVVWQIEAYGTPSDKLDLASLTLSGGELKTPFSPENTEYVVDVATANDVPTVSATAKHDDMEVKITQANSETLKATVEVIYKNLVKRTYTVDFVVLSSDATLADISAGGETILGFDRETFTYTVLWNKSTDWPVFEATAMADGYATITYKQPSKADARASITVTSQDGTATNTYNLNVLMNTALKKATSCSSGYNGSYSQNALDGSYTTKWYCASNTGTQWMWVDLESMTDIYKIYAYGVSTMKVTNYDIIEMSANGSDWERVPTSIVASTATNIGDNHILLDYTFEPIKARFIRISGSAVAKMQIWELEVYGIGDPIVSANTYLKSLELSHGELSPSFNKHDTVYTVQVGANEELPTITACETDDTASTYEITQATLATLSAKVTVTAENGISKRTYTINFEKEILPEKNAALSNLSISHGELMPEFNAKVSEYAAIVAVDDAIPTVSATTAVQGAGISIVQATDSAPATITVTSPDGTESQVYTVEIIKKSAKLSSLTVEGYEIDFNPDTYDYVVYLPANSTDIPAVSGVMADPSSSMYVTQATSSKMKATIAIVTSGDEQEKTYTVTFIHEASLEDDFLRAQTAVSNVNVSNDSVAEDFMNAAKGALTNERITASWKEDFKLTKATDTKSGSVKGIIELALYGQSVYITIDKSIAPLSSGSSGGGGGGSSSGGGGGGSSSGGGSATVTPPAGDDDPVTPPTDTVNKNALKESAKGHWAETEICALIDAGIVQGDENGDLQLDKRVTRAELLTMLLRSVGAEFVPYADTMADVRSNDWHSSALQTAHNMGWVSGYQGYFRPNDTITREEAAKILCFAAGVNAEETNTDSVTFSDMEKVSDWAVSYIKLAAATGLMQGFDTGDFGPDMPLTRAQAMTICYRVMTGGAAE